MKNWNYYMYINHVHVKLLWVFNDYSWWCRTFIMIFMVDLMNNDDISFRLWREITVSFEWPKQQSSFIYNYRVQNNYPVRARMREAG